MSSGQIQLFQGLNAPQLQSYINDIQAVKAASAGMFNSTVAQNYANAIQNLEANQAALLLSTQGLTNAQIAETLAANESNVAKNYQAMVEAGLLKNKQSLTLAQVQENLQTVLGAEADTSAAMAALGLSAAIEGQEHQTVQITAEKLKETVTTNALTEAQAQEFAMRTGVMASMNAQAASGIPAWTRSMKAATTAVWLQVKAQAALMATNLTTWIMGAVTAIGIGKAVFNKYGQAVEEARRAAEESANAYKETASSVEGYAKRYKDLHTALLAAKGNEEETYAVKKQLLELQTELNDKFGEEYGRINLVTDAYKDQTDAIKAFNKEAAQTFLNENHKEIQKATERMTEEGHYNLSYSESLYSDEGKALREIAEKYKGQGMSIQEDVNGAEYTIHLNADPQSAYNTIQDFESDVRDRAKELGDEHIFDDVLEVSSASLNSAKDNIDKYGDTYRQSLVAGIATDDGKSKTYGELLEKVKAYNEAVAQSESPYDDEKVEKARQDLQALQDEINNDESWRKYGAVIEDTFGQADTRVLDFQEHLKNDEELQQIADGLKGLDDLDLKSLDDSYPFGKLKEEADKYHITVEELIDSFIRLGYVQGEISSHTSSAIPPLSKEEMISAINKMSEGFEELDKLYESVSDKDPFDFKLLDNDKFKDTFSGLGDSYTNFIETISNSPSDIIACQSAFDKLLTAWIDSTGILDQVSESTAGLTTDMLSNMGVVNAEELVVQALAESHEKAAAEKYYHATASAALEGATANEVARILEEAEAAGISSSELARLELAKIAVNGAQISTSSDIDQIISLANAAGASAAALYRLQAAKAAVSGSSLVDPTSKNYDRFAAIEGEHSKYLLNTGKFDYNFQEIDASKYKTAVYGGGNKSNKPSSGGGSKKKEKKDAEEVYDWIETLIKRTDEKIEELQKKATDAKGWRAKNALQDTVFDELQKKLVQLQADYDRYMQEANSVGLSDIYINKIQNGELDIERLESTEENEAVKEKIKEYQTWYDKAKSCKDELENTNDKIRETRELKLDNIINDYDQIVGLMKSYTNYRKDLIDVRDRMGDTPRQDDYQELINDQAEIYDTLSDKYNELEQELNSGGIEEGTDKWYDMREELINIKSEMIGCANAVEDFKDRIFELRFKPLEDLLSKLDSANSELSNMLSLIGDDGLVKDGMLSNRGLSAVALYSRQIINAKKEAEEYKAAIKALNATYRNGDITLDEYNEKLYEYRSAQQDAALATKEARDAIIALREEAINQEIEAMEELIQSKVDLLDKEQELYEYQKKIASDNRNIALLERQIRVLSLSSDRADVAQRLQLEAELAKAREELDEYQREHSVETQKDALEEEGEAYKEAKENEIENLKTNLDAQEALIRQYLNQVKSNYGTVYGVLTTYADEYNMEVTEDLTSPFSSAEAASQSFSDVFSDMVSSIQYQIDSIDWGNLTRGFDDMELENDLGDGSDNWEDVTKQGKWHQNNTGWWYGSSDDDYVSNGYYNINGKTYNFNEDGYMKSGWDDSQGDWYYFEPENGEMVKSTWRKDKKGDWYYLQSDGTMAVDAAVKAKNGKGFYLLDSDGKWDGETVLTRDEVDELGYDVAYKNGTRNAKAGIALTDEEGLGSEVVLTKHGSFRQVQSGDHVFSAEQTEAIWNLSKRLLDGSAVNLNSLNNWGGLSNGARMSLPEDVLVSHQITVNNNNSVNVQGDASERTVQLIGNAINDFAKNRMGRELMKQIRYDLK